MLKVYGLIFFNVVVTPSQNFVFLKFVHNQVFIENLMALIVSEKIELKLETVMFGYNNKKFL